MSAADYLPWLGTILTFLTGSGFLARYVQTRNEKVKAQADAATAVATSAKTQSEATAAKFEVSQKEWDFMSKRVDRLIADNERLENRFSVLQLKADADAEASRVRVGQLEAQIDELREELRACEAIATAWRIWGLAMEGAIKQLAPGIVQKQIMARLEYLHVEKPANEPQEKETH